MAVTHSVSTSGLDVYWDIDVDSTFPAFAWTHFHTPVTGDSFANLWNWRTNVTYGVPSLSDRMPLIDGISSKLKYATSDHYSVNSIGTIGDTTGPFTSVIAPAFRIPTGYVSSSGFFDTEWTNINVRTRGKFYSMTYSGSPFSPMPRVCMVVPSSIMSLFSSDGWVPPTHAEFEITGINGYLKFRRFIRYDSASIPGTDNFRVFNHCDDAKLGKYVITSTDDKPCFVGAFNSPLSTLDAFGNVYYGYGAIYSGQTSLSEYGKFYLQTGTGDPAPDGTFYVYFYKADGSLAGEGYSNPVGTVSKVYDDGIVYGYEVYGTITMAVPSGACYYVILSTTNQWAWPRYPVLCLDDATILPGVCPRLA